MQTHESINGGSNIMSKLESASFLIKNGYVKTRYFNGKFQVKITPKGKEAYLLLNRLKELSK